MLQPNSRIISDLAVAVTARMPLLMAAISKGMHSD